MSDVLDLPSTSSFTITFLLLKESQDDLKKQMSFICPKPSSCFFRPTSSTALDM